ncbi:hypothetical protein GBA52_004247 [Prunus armeniaca]|nr:hypothetical protein GBA52_004247 [Prunus armeniaca]
MMVVITQKSKYTTKATCTARKRISSASLCDQCTERDVNVGVRWARQRRGEREKPTKPLLSLWGERERERESNTNNDEGVAWCGVDVLLCGGEGGFCGTGTHVKGMGGWL